MDNIEQRPTNIPVNHLLEIGLGLLRRNCPLLYFHEIHFHFHENMYHAKGIIIFVVHESPKFMIFSRECFRPIPSRRGGGEGQAAGIFEKCHYVLSLSAGFLSSVIMSTLRNFFFTKKSMQFVGLKGFAKITIVFF